MVQLDEQIHAAKPRLFQPDLQQDGILVGIPALHISVFDDVILIAVPGDLSVLAVDLKMDVRVGPGGRPHQIFAELKVVDRIGQFQIHGPVGIAGDHIFLCRLIRQMGGNRVARKSHGHHRQQHHQTQSHRRRQKPQPQRTLFAH